MILTNEDLYALTGYKRGGDQAKWMREQLGLEPAIAADGRPRLTADALTAAMLARGGKTSATSAKQVQPKWTTA